MLGSRQSQAPASRGAASPHSAASAAAAGEFVQSPSWRGAVIGYDDDMGDSRDPSRAPALTPGSGAQARLPQAGRSGLLARIARDAIAASLSDAAANASPRVLVPDAADAAPDCAAAAHEDKRPAAARAAALAGLPIQERVFPLELPRIPRWPAAEMLAIPPGQFLMGAADDEEGAWNDEFPRHEVRIEYVVALGRRPVTFAEWRAALHAGARLHAPDDRGWGAGARPVMRVSWEDAKAYCHWLNCELGLVGRRDAYRLPSEAEWEYACRAGTTSPFHFGATVSTAQANFDGAATYGACVASEPRKQTTPVGSFPPNDFGLYDMHGNVWEWCEDPWHDDYLGAPADGSVWRTGGDDSLRVLRGGSWGNGPHFLRCAYRSANLPTGRSIGIGLRLARTLMPDGD